MMNEKNLIEEKEYLRNVLGYVDKMISDTKEEHDYNKKEYEDIALPDLEQKSYFRKCKERVFKTEERMNYLKEFRKNTHFGRMDLELKEESLTESLIMYLGEKSINDGIRNIVYDWRSPVGNLYYMSNQEDFKFNETVYELNLKRQIEIDNSEIVNIYDSFIKGSDLNVTDNFLIKVLENKKNRNEFTDIIKTIQSNQNAIIRDSLETNSIIQGVAGSGKTVVLLHRLSYLLYNYPTIDKEKLAFITPSKIFQSKLSKINRSLSLTSLKMFPMEDYYHNKIKEYIPPIKIKSVIKDDYKKEVLEFIYSDDYNVYLENIISEYRKTDNSKKKENIKIIMDLIFKDLKIKFNLKKKSWLEDKKCIKAFAFTILKIYNLYGFTAYTDFNYLFIDEMQDYSDNEYKLINALEKKCYLNLYGDVEQAILPYIKKKTLDGLSNLLKDIKQTDNVNVYKLSENYRNSRQIINYCNQFLKVKMLAMGISSDEVKVSDIYKKDVIKEIIDNYDKNVVVIVNDTHLLEEISELGYEAYNVKNAKGLEFSKVVVIEEDFMETEKYVAYTRTLDKLYIYKLKTDN
ncbi:MAG: AAA family ATPase [Bacilli bacterium]